MPLFLEHAWLWLASQPHGRSLWDLPFFHPMGRNALAYSDTMLSFGPFYWPWRALGLPPDTSVQLWLLSVLAASALAVHGFLRLLRLPWPIAAWGAWVATMSASRMHQISHPQLLPMMYVAVMLAGAVGYATASTPRHRRWYVGALVGGLVAQLYGGVYMAFFAVLTIGLLLAVTLALPSSRRNLLGRVRQDVVPWLVAAALAAVALLPWWRHYTAASALGERRWREIAVHLPRPASWLLVPAGAAVQRIMPQPAFFADIPKAFEHAVSPGWITLGVMTFAAVACRRDRRVQITGAAVLLAIALTTVWPGGWSAWSALVSIAPPLSAIRVVVRVGLLLPLAAAVIVGIWLTVPGRLPLQRRIAFALAVLVAAEQLGRLRTHDKAAERRWVEALVQRVDPQAPAFYVARWRARPDASLVAVDAMWAALMTGVPTVNGQSAVILPGSWALRWIVPVADAPAAPPALRSWLDRHGGDPRTQVIYLPRGYRRSSGGQGQSAGGV